MPGKTDLSELNCSLARTLEIVGDWWTLLIIRDAFLGVRRFGDFQKSLGIARTSSPRDWNVCAKTTFWSAAGRKCGPSTG